jgi:hypothetical protein
MAVLVEPVDYASKPDVKVAERTEVDLSPGRAALPGKRWTQRSLPRSIVNLALSPCEPNVRLPLLHGCLTMYPE